MTDYTSLVTALRTKVSRDNRTLLDESADAIEQLQRERNYLLEQCKGCENCKHAQKSFHEEPCSSCKWKSNFEWRGIK